MSSTKQRQIAARRKRPLSRGNHAFWALQSGPILGSAFQEIVRTRLRDRTPNMAVLAAFLKIDPSIIQRRLREGGTALCLDFLGEVTSFYQMSVSEMCAVPGSLWQEIKPDEAQLLAHFRQLTYTQRHGLLAVLEGRLSQPAKSRRAQFGSVALTEEQQLLVDLYVQSEPQAREGVMKILKGTARKAAQPDLSTPAPRREK